MRNLKGQFVKGTSGFLGKHTKKSKLQISKNRMGKAIGKSNGNWIGGRFHSAGYIYVIMKNHPSAGKNGYILEHRAVMEKHLGRTLLSTEIVHHINGVRDDNRVENLQLFSSQREHKIAEYKEMNKCPTCGHIIGGKSKKI